MIDAAAAARTLIVACALTASSVGAADNDAVESAEKRAARAQVEEFGTREPYDAAKGFAALLDEPSIRTVSSAARIEVLRLKGQKHQDPQLDGYFTASAKPGEPSVHGFAIERQFVITNAAFIARLKQVVLSPTSYRHYTGVKLCGGFQPKVVFRFSSYGATVDVLLCFNCEDVGVSGVRSQTESPRIPLAVMKSDAWWSLAKEALPDDAFIQRQTPRR